MEAGQVRIGLAAAIMFFSASGVVFSQAPAPPPPPTLWSFLGIPQGLNKIHGNLFNRRGNHPRLEKKPPLKALADPANLESPVPAIKRAAEVKQAEDLAPQKIKAVKYLAKIGCGCYDKDGSITQALVAATDDCTESVRLATIEAIRDAAEGQKCEQCGQTCCCNEDILKQLAKIAYERDDKGCYVEPSERVRQAAAETLEVCCPSTAPPVIVTEEPTPQPGPVPEQPELGPTPETPEGTPPPPPPPETPEGIQPPPPPPETPEGTPPPPPEASISAPRTRLHSPRADVSSTASPRSTMNFYQRYGALTNSAQHIGNSNVAHQVEADIDGVVVQANAELGLAHVHLNDADRTLALGTQLHVYGQNPQQSTATAGHLEVVQTFPGSVNARIVGIANLNQLRPGATVKIVQHASLGQRGQRPSLRTEGIRPSVTGHRPALFRFSGMQQR